MTLVCLTAPVDTCPHCGTPEQRLYETDLYPSRACPECIRRGNRGVHRYTVCDSCGAPGAWRNPFTRRNEYLCPRCHALSGDGVVQLLQPRTSEPLDAARRPQCAVRDNDCRGEVKPQGPTGELLCRKHAGKRSAAWDIEDQL